MPTWTPEGFSKELGRRMKRLDREFRDAAYGVAQRGELEGAVVAERLGIVDRRTYIQRFKALRTRLGAELRNDAPHAGVIEHGRRAGRKPPPTAVILSWIRRKGIDVTKLADVRRGSRRKKRGSGRTKGRRTGVQRAQRQLAFLIARAIGRKGRPGHHVFQRHLVPKLRGWWTQELRKILAES